MSKGDRLLVVIALALVVLALGVLTYITVRQHTAIVQARTQIRQQQTELATLKNSLVTRIAGSHRDLITCGDISALINSGAVASYYVDSNFNLQSTPAMLPAHCINP